MRIRTVCAGVVSACVVAACGSAGSRSPTVARPPAPINLSVLVSDSRVMVSPSSAGAGPIVFVITNQASNAEALAITDAHGSTLASTAPINPQGTTQVSVDFAPGRYTLATAPHGLSEAQLTRPPRIRPASLRVGRPRTATSNELLQP